MLLIRVTNDKINISRHINFIIGGAIQMNKNITVQCFTCKKKFNIDSKKYAYNIRHNCHFYCSSECQYENKKTGEIVKCKACGKEIYRRKSDMKKNISGNFFCSKSCAASFNNASSPKRQVTNYRIKAFRTYPHRCEICGFFEDEKLLEVHHIDENRKNNDIENLIILCPICHAKITRKLYRMIKRKLVKIKNIEIEKIALK